MSKKGKKPVEKALKKAINKERQKVVKNDEI